MVWSPSFEALRAVLAARLPGPTVTQLGLETRAQPVECWVRNVTTALDTLWPGFAEPEERALGRLLAQAFAQGPVGRAMRRSAPAVGPAAVLQRFARSSSLRDNFTQVLVHQRRAGQFRLTTTPQPLPFIFAGLLEGELALSGSAARAWVMTSAEVTVYEVCMEVDAQARTLDPAR